MNVFLKFQIKRNKSLFLRESLFLNIFARVMYFLYEIKVFHLIAKIVIHQNSRLYIFQIGKSNH